MKLTFKFILLTLIQFQITACATFKHELTPYSKGLIALWGDDKEDGKKLLSKECEAGNLDACFFRYEADRKNCADCTNSSNFEKLCKNKQPQSCNTFALMELFGHKRASAKSSFKQACQLESPFGCYSYGMMALHDGPNKEDLRLIENSCLKNPGIVCFAAGKIAQRFKNKKDAELYLSISCEHFESGCGDLALLKGQTIEKNEEINLAKKACYFGDVLGCRLLERTKTGTASTLKCTKSTPESCELLGLTAEKMSLNAEAFDYYDRGCHNEHGWSCYHKARHDLNQGEYKSAKSSFSKACSLGVGRSCLTAVTTDFDGREFLYTGTAIGIQADASCKLGDGLSCYLAQVLLYEKGKREDFKKIDFSESCNKGYGSACLAQFRKKYSDGDKDKAKEDALKMCNDGYAASCGLLSGYVYYEKNVAEASELAKKGCRLGDFDSCGFFSSICSDEKTAETMQRDLCDRFSAESCSKLGAKKFSEGERNEGIKFLRRGCELGDSDACELLIEKKLGYSFGANHLLRVYRNKCITGNIKSCENYERQRIKMKNG